MSNKPEQPDIDELKAEERVTEIMESVDSQATATNTTTPSAPEGTPAEDSLPPFSVEQPSDPLGNGVEDPLPEQPDTEPVPLPSTEDAATDTAVEDILHNDADAVLPDQPKPNAVVMKSSLKERFRNFWLDWWSNPWKRYGTIAVLLALIAVGAFVTPVRAMILNTVGIRSSIMVNVYDGATNLPLQNAVVQVDNKSAKTNTDGEVKLTDLRLGKKTVKISKVGFASTTKQVSLGMRIIDLGDVTLKSVGTQLTFVFTDYLSGKTVADVSLTSGESTAKSDKDGKAVITLQQGSTKDSKITVSKDGYRSDSVGVPSDLSAAIKYKIVPGVHAIFVSKASGKYDVYKTYLDGKDRAVLLAGTGLENQSIATLPSPSGDVVAVASTRDDKRDSGGYVLTALNIVDVSSGDRTNLEYAEQISLLGWSGSTLVYQQTVAGASAANASRQKIIAYDTSSGKRYQLANANYFVGAQLIGSTLYYTVSATDPSSPSTFARIKIDGSGKNILYTGTIWSFLRSSYDTIKIQTQDKWYDYTVSTAKLAASKPTSDYTSRMYVDSPDAKTSVSVDVRDINGVLVARNLSTAKETELVTQKNMQAPLYWLNNSTVAYRVSGSNEVADYAISIDGGKAQKIADVSLTGVR